jgi:hypothetical protein
MLPYAVLATVLGMHGMNLMPGIVNKDVVTNFLRKRGLAAPYAVGQTIVNKDLGKAQERTLAVEKAYASLKDNINNYKKTAVVAPDALLGANKTKQHPWEMVMTTEACKTFAEDILDALFPGERNLSDLTPLGCFDGYDTIIADDISAGRIATGEGNFITGLGDITLPSDESDVDAFNQLLSFFRSADPQLRASKTLLLVPYGIADAYDSAFFNKHKYIAPLDAYGRTILTGSEGKCSIVRSNIMGSGQRIILTVEGNFDFGMNTQGDEDFVQVRQPYEDPNEVQFWIQGDYGCRIRSVHKKVFQINDGTPVANALSGDYVS